VDFQWPKFIADSDSRKFLGRFLAHKNLAAITAIEFGFRRHSIGCTVYHHCAYKNCQYSILPSK